MKIKISILLLLLSITMEAQTQSRWNIVDRHTIQWKISKDIPHKDHVEMSGERVSVVYRYEIDDESRFHIERSVIWPILRTKPNNTHASLTQRFTDSFINGITVDSHPIGHERVEWLQLDGKLSVRSHFGDLEVTRCFFPSVDRAMVCEEYRLQNNGQKELRLKIPAIRSVTQTDSTKGMEGSYTLVAATSHRRDRTITLPVGKSISFGASIQGYKFPEVEALPEIAKECEAREAFVDEICSQLQFVSPDETLNTMFAFAKIRCAESIFRTRGGLMHSPGGEAYYAAMWCNDQAEYVSPFFPFLGYGKGNESALNCFLHFAKYMNPEFRYIPWSVIAEGYDSFGRFDRGDAAMLAYGASRYALAKGDATTAEMLWPLIEWSLEYCRRKLNRHGVVASDADELELRFPAGKANLCTSSLYYDALRSASLLAEELNLGTSQTETYREQAETLRKNIGTFFEATVNGFETYRYFEENDLLRSWICIPLVMDIFDRKEGTVAALLSPHLWTENGILTQAGSNVFWDRATLYALRGIYASGHREEATERLRSYAKRRLLGDHVPYPVEAWPEGNQRHLSAESGLFCRVFTEGLFGFRPTGFGSFSITPQLPAEWKFMELKNIHACTDKPFDISIRRKGEKLSVEFLRNKKCFKKTLLKNGESFQIKLE